MAEGKGTRLVILANGRPAILFHDVESNGNRLLTFDFSLTADAKVDSIGVSSHARYGIDFCEADENPNTAIKSSASTLIEQQQAASMPTATEQPIENVEGLKPDTRATWERVTKPDGTHYASKAEWKAAGSPVE